MEVGCPGLSQHTDVVAPAPCVSARTHSGAVIVKHVVPGPVASTLPGNLLEKRILRPHPSSSHCEVPRLLGPTGGSMSQGWAVPILNTLLQAGQGGG